MFGQGEQFNVNFDNTVPCIGEGAWRRLRWRGTMGEGCYSTRTAEVEWILPVLPGQQQEGWISHEPKQFTAFMFNSHPYFY